MVKIIILDSPEKFHGNISPKAKEQRCSKVHYYILISALNYIHPYPTTNLQTACRRHRQQAARSRDAPGSSRRARSRGDRRRRPSRPPGRASLRPESPAGREPARWRATGRVDANEINTIEDLECRAIVWTRPHDQRYKYKPKPGHYLRCTSILVNAVEVKRRAFAPEHLHPYSKHEQPSFGFDSQLLFT